MIKLIFPTLIYDGETFENVGVRFKGQNFICKYKWFSNGGGPGGGGPGGGGPGGNNVDTDKKSFNIELIGKQIKILTVMKH